MAGCRVAGLPALGVGRFCASQLKSLPIYGVDDYVFPLEAARTSGSKTSGIPDLPFS